MKSAHSWAFIVVMLVAPMIFDARLPNNKNIKKAETQMSNTQKNKEIIRKIYEDGLNKRNLQLLDKYISPEFTGIRGMKGAAGFREPVSQLINAFNDIQWTIEELIAEDNKVMVRWTWQGTHTNQFANFVATGKKITNEGFGVFEFENDKIIRSTVQTDRAGFFQAMEVLPADLAALTNKKGDKVSFIDKFFVPAAAKKEFYERLNINHNLIKKLAGLVDNAAYEYTDGNGNLICVTIAGWANMEMLNKAREVIQAEYKKQGFDGAEMFKRLNITVDRGIYKHLGN
jgi:steroid delta-isomerase-like uncharacterized protein